MSKDFTSPTWSDAFQGFILHLKATRAPKTVNYYQTILKALIFWAESNHVSLEKFGKRQMDTYLVFRSKMGLAQLTLHHDAVCTKAFMKWCQKNDYVKTSLLADYEVRNAPAPYKYMPTDEDMQKLVAAVRDVWDVEKHPDCRYNSPARRAFNRDRNYAIILLLLDSACRINEVLHLKLDDYREKERQITIRESKGREPRSIPVSKDAAEAIAVWLKVRQRAMKDVPMAEDEGWLFISETGRKNDNCLFLKTLKRITCFAGLPTKITLHSLRRYSLNRLAKHNLLAAQTIAGHKDTKTTLIYTKIDPDFVREMHEEVGVVRGILQSKRDVARRRLI